MTDADKLADKLHRRSPEKRRVKRDHESLSSAPEGDTPSRLQAVGVPAGYKYQRCGAYGSESEGHTDTETASEGEEGEEHGKQAKQAVAAEGAHSLVTQGPTSKPLDNSVGKSSHISNHHTSNHSDGSTTTNNAAVNTAENTTVFTAENAGGNAATAVTTTATAVESGEGSNKLQTNSIPVRNAGAEQLGSRGDNLKWASNSSDKWKNTGGNSDDNDNQIRDTNTASTSGETILRKTWRRLFGSGERGYCYRSAISGGRSPGRMIHTDSDRDNLADSEEEKRRHIFLHNPKSLGVRAIDWLTVVRIHYLSHVYMLFLSLTLYHFVGVPPAEKVWGILEFVQAFYYQKKLLLVSHVWAQQLLCWMLVSTLVFVKLFGGFFVLDLLLPQRFLKRNVYCVDFEVAEPPEGWRVTRARTSQLLRDRTGYNEESLKFMNRLLDVGGVGETTALPPTISDAGRLTKGVTINDERQEYETLIFPMLADLLKRTKCEPKEIDFLVINCSLFSPTPSLCAIVANKLGMREDLCSYNLGGMGCSAGVISIDLAKQLIQNRAADSTALVISTEMISNNLYEGNERSFLLQNTLFRCGAAAILLSSKKCYKGAWAKYQLLHSGRTLISDEKSYQCVYQDLDPTGKIGVKLSRDIIQVAGNALTKQFTALGPHVLPMSEQLKCLLSMVGRQCGKWLMQRGMIDNVEYRKNKLFKVYTPDFRSCIDHFCIHAGGRAVIEGVQKNLDLSDRHVEPSFMTLKQRGNTSSSSIWYELKYIEDTPKLGLCTGHRVLQIAFGSGFKCNSAVWLRL